jgi:outer membrane protein OmpA-like peptidoglycan-associated protein
MIPRHLIAPFAALALGAVGVHAQNLTGRTSDLTMRTEVLVMATTGLVFHQENLAGAAQNLGSAAQNFSGQVQGLQVKETATETRIALAADILFDFDKAEIRPTAAAALSLVAGVLRQRAVGIARIEGHTDVKGAPAYNQKLSQRRAASVQNWLAEREGLVTIRFALQGLGATRPVAPNTKPDGSDDPDGRQKNRRVEIVFGRM